MKWGYRQMFIWKGEFFSNRTRKYLLPIMIKNGSFTKLFMRICVAAVGIDDAILNDIGKEYKEHLFILIDVLSTKDINKDIEGTFKSIREHPYYETDYSFDLNNKYRMFVFKFPSFYINALYNFKKGRYSKMLDVKNIRQIFKSSKQEKIKKVLLKDNHDDFIRDLEKNFNLRDINISDLEEHDFPPHEREEVFNKILFENE